MGALGAASLFNGENGVASNCEQAHPSSSKLARAFWDGLNKSTKSMQSFERDQRLEGRRKKRLIERYGNNFW